MMKIFKPLSIFVLTLASAFIFINAGDSYLHDISNDCSIENTAIQGGEKIVYKAYYNWEFVWIPAGEAEFNIKENEDTYEITVVGKTYRGYDAFFRVRDYFHSVVDKKTMYPRSFVRIVEEGKYRKFDSLVFNQNQLNAVSFNGKSRSTAKRKVITIHQCTHDLLSVLYFMRNMNVAKHKPGDMIPTKILFDETIYPIKVRYEGKYDQFNIKDLGTFNTIKVIPDLVTGNVFKDGNRMHVWVTNDGNKLPLLIESPLSVGSAKAVLKSFSGLKYPFSLTSHKN
ncbi:MAG: DUF3108 domain-containing protein [Saprospiraceae bacterium]|nr:DUF3108 domain-containing protein [Saprospiraceae bacterium]MBK8668472.1 DUF3108 domain-containing protein [Saprospiraceae bacterium]MBL0098800.1 DUF3108 domain-containing protein [Saprospiraceae bacterium]